MVFLFYSFTIANNAVPLGMWVYFYSCSLKLLSYSRGNRGPERGHRQWVTCAGQEPTSFLFQTQFDEFSSPPTPCMATSHCPKIGTFALVTYFLILASWGCPKHSHFLSHVDDRSVAAFPGGKGAFWRWTAVCERDGDGGDCTECPARPTYQASVPK